MAWLDKVEVPVTLSIDHETVDRCCRILGMYMTDNRDKTIEVKEGRTKRGILIREVVICERGQ